MNKLAQMIANLLDRRSDEQREIDSRNAERRALCIEYRYNLARQPQILRRLAVLSGEANLEAATARLADELAERRSQPQQAMMVAPERIDANIKQAFAFSIAAMPEGPTEDDCGFTVDGLAGQWNKPVQA